MIKISYTLYHGTIVDNKDSIERYGLEPQVGRWVEEVLHGTGLDWEEESMDDHGLVFAADKSRLDMATYAMMQHISYKIGKSTWDITEDDIVSHGMIVIIKDGEEYFQKRPADEDAWHYMREDIEYETKNPLIAVEPEDWFSTEGAPADIILTGRKLLSYIKRRGTYPLKRKNTHGYEKWLREQYIKKEKQKPQQELFPRSSEDILGDISESSEDEILEKLEALAAFLENGFKKESIYLNKIIKLSKDDIKISRRGDYTRFSLDNSDGPAYVEISENNKWAQGAHSVFNFFVSERRRREGLGSRLIRAVISYYGSDEISAQVSSLGSLNLFWKLGFRPPGNSSASKEGAIHEFKEYQSLNLRLNEKE